MPELSSTEKSRARSHPHKQKRYLAVHPVSTVFSAQVNDGSIAPRGAREITYDNGSGTYTDVKAGMTLWVGSAAGQRDLGTVRIRSITSTVITVAENDHIEWADDLHLTCKELYEIWPKKPRIATDGTFYKDYDIEVGDHTKEPPPKACAGPPAIGFLSSGSCSLNFYGEDSLAIAPGASLSSYSWTFPSGTPSSTSAQGSKASPIAVSWSAAGFYYVAFTVTDDNSNTGTVYVPVWIFDRTGSDAPYTEFRTVSRNGDRASYEIHGDADTSEFPLDALIVEFTEDFYNSNTAAYVGGRSHRQNVKFVGWIERVNFSRDSEGVGRVTIEAISHAGKMEQTRGFPITVEDDSKPQRWHQVESLTVQRALMYILEWHSTVNQVADVLFYGSRYTRQVQRRDFPKGNLLGQLNQMALDRGIMARVGATRWGEIIIAPDPQYLPPTERNAVATVIDLENQDMREPIDVREQLIDKLGYVEAGGFYYDGRVSIPYLSGAPGPAPGRVPPDRRVSGLVLSGQSDLNYYSGAILAQANNRYPEVSIPLAGNYDNAFDPALMEYITIDYVSGDTRRGLVWTNQKCIVRDAEVQELDNGVTLTTIRAEPLVDVIDGQTITFDHAAPTPPSRRPPAGPAVVVALDTGIFYTPNVYDLSPTWYNISQGLASDDAVYVRDLIMDPFANDLNVARDTIRMYAATEDGLYTCIGPLDGGLWTRLLSSTDMDAICSITGALPVALAMCSQLEDYVAIAGADTAGHLFVMNTYSGATSNTASWAGHGLGSYIIAGPGALACSHHTTSSQPRCLVIGVETGVVYLKDNGATTNAWTYYNNGSAWPHPVCYYKSTSYDDDDGILEYTDDDGVAYVEKITSMLDGTAATTDIGDSSMVAPSIGKVGGNYGRLLWTPTDGGTLYVVDDSYAWISTDEGANWSIYGESIGSADSGDGFEPNCADGDRERGIVVGVHDPSEPAPGTKPLVWLNRGGNWQNKTGDLLEVANRPYICYQIRMLHI